MIMFECKPDDGERFEVEADSRDVLHWETRKNGRHLGMIQNTPRMADLTELAWLAAKRRAVWDGDLADFREAVAVRPIEQSDDALLDPTQPAA